MPIKEEENIVHSPSVNTVISKTNEKENESISHDTGAVINEEEIMKKLPVKVILKKKKKTVFSTVRFHHLLHYFFFNYGIFSQRIYCVFFKISFFL